MQALDELRQELSLKKRENEKLEKINAALMYRMEEGGFNHHSYRAFEHSVQLSEKVNQKTEELQAVLQKLAQSNAEIVSAHEENNKAKQRLHDAIESTSQAMVLLDQFESIVFFNSHFETVWDNLSITPHIGDNYHEITQSAKRLGVIRRVLPADPEGITIYQLSNLRWYQVTNRRTQEGGKVILFNDITEVKLNESNRYEQVIREKSKLLQSLIDNIDVGILLIKRNGEIIFWNRTFLVQSNVSPSVLINCNNIYALQNAEGWNGLNFDADGPNTQIVNDNLVVDRDITALPDGNILCTFTNVTSQHQYAETLKQNESWIRMMTDNVPALIAYIGTDNKFRYTNKGYRDWYGVSEQNLNDMPMEKSHLEDIYPHLIQYLRRVNDGEVVSFQSQERNAQGIWGFLQKVYLPHFSEDGEIMGHFVLATDISEQVKSKKALEDAKNQLENNVEKRTRELNQANIALQEAVDSKSKFLAAISHDLMQPLSAAILFNESLKDQVDASASLVVKALDNSLSDLNSLIRTLIETSKLDAGVLQPDRQIENVMPLLMQLADEFSQISKDYRVDFRYRFQEAYVETDLSLLSRILRNLLVNAMKYGTNGKVLLTARKVKDCLRISVFDQGVGINEQDQKVIFKEFSRLENDFNYSYSLGLGLYIVDKMTKLLGHNIDVRSEEGIGACFTVHVPIATPRTLVTAHEYSQSIEQLLPNDLLEKQVWHIDNDANMRIAMQTLFSNWGMEIESFSGYQQCVAVTDDCFDECDMLVVDYHLDEDITGLDIAKQVRSRYPHIPIMICTANHSKALALELEGTGVQLLHKPITSALLKASLIKMLPSANAIGKGGKRSTGKREGG
ncbi:ATP-binding protein [Alteromonas sp. A081]|uniref:ATP-binding protein n=1 Tax=Alteromonas sp. A081 TaxID=3410269 RepID=UPI003B97DCE1